MSRIRLRFSKLGKIRWTSHRDVARMWERAFRRVQLPLAYTAGFSPRPRVSFGLALPTGHESVAEYLDLELLPGPVDVGALPARLSAALPDGVIVTAAAEIDPRAPSLQEDVTSSTWQLTAVPAEDAGALSLDELSARVEAVMASPSAVITRVRKGVEVTDDIRGGILGVRVVRSISSDPAAGILLEADLATTPRSIRPSELLLALGTALDVPNVSPSGRTSKCLTASDHPASLLEERDVRRLHQWILRNGARTEPLVVSGPDAATDAPHTYECAS